MTLVIDAGPLVAAADLRDPLRIPVQRVISRERGGLIVPAPVTAEVDYLLGRRVGRSARLSFIEDIASGRFTVECLHAEEYEAIGAIERTYADLDVGLADASVVVIADRFRTRRLLTFDQRHFRAVRPIRGGSFVLLPADRPA